MRAVEMPRAERRKRMRALRKRVLENDVAHWSETFLARAARRAARARRRGPARRARVDVRAPDASSEVTWRCDPRSLGALRELARVPHLLVALDFDGTLAPEVDSPEQARALPEAREAVLRLLALPEPASPS